MEEKETIFFQGKSKCLIYGTQYTHPKNMHKKHNRTGKSPLTNMMIWNQGGNMYKRIYLQGTSPVFDTLLPPTESTSHRPDTYQKRKKTK